MSCTQGTQPVAPVESKNTHSLPRQIRLCPSEASDAKYFYDITKDQLFVSKCITLMGPNPALMSAWKFLVDLYK